MLNILIVDDEFKGREYLKQVLEKYFSDKISGLRVCDSYESALEEIKNFKPNLLLLDIEMPFKSGFDILEHAGPYQFEVIFTTAFNQYAIKAIKYNALDYLLKPIDKNELELALNKTIKRLKKQAPQTNLAELLTHLKSGLNKQIGLPTITGVLLIDVNRIIRFEAAGNYTNVMLEGNRKELVCRTLKEIEEAIKAYPFFRVHKSHIIAINHISEYQRSDGGFVLMKDGAQIPVSKNHKDELISLLNVI